MKKTLAVIILLLVATTAFAEALPYPLASQQRFGLYPGISQVWYSGHEARTLLRGFRFKKEVALYVRGSYAINDKFSVVGLASRSLDNRLVTVTLGGEYALIGSNK